MTHFMYVTFSPFVSGLQHSAISHIIDRIRHDNSMNRKLFVKFVEPNGDNDD